jgi:hypothetical protein
MWTKKQKAVVQDSLEIPVGPYEQVDSVQSLAYLIEEFRLSFNDETQSDTKSSL